jgi:hypothetical protein
MHLLKLNIMPKANKYIYAIAVMAMIFHLFAALSFMRSAAPTFDEPVHLASGYSYWITGRYELNILDHPPLTEMMASFPLLFLSIEKFLDNPYFKLNIPYGYGDILLHKNNVDADIMLNISRGFLLLIWTILYISFFYIYRKEIRNNYYFPFL